MTAPPILNQMARTLEAGRYNRWSEQISWLSVQTAKGKLFDVDTRLRPDGKSGSLAIHIHRPLPISQVRHGNIVLSQSKDY